MHHIVYKFSKVNTAKPLEAKPRDAKHIFLLIFPNSIFILSRYLRILLPIIAFLSDFLPKLSSALTDFSPPVHATCTPCYTFLI